MRPVVISVGASVIVGLIWSIYSLSESDSKGRHMSSFETSSSDLNGLSRLIALPSSPKQVQWQLLSRGVSGGIGPSDWILVAILTFENQQLKELLERAKPIPARKSLLSAEDMSRIQGDFRQRLDEVITEPVDASWFSGESFFKSPLLQGAFAHDQQSSEIVLCLYTQ